jgi:hypothetical protein
MFSVWVGSGDTECLNTILIMASKGKCDVFKSDLNMDLLIIKANIIHDKLNFWHKKIRSVCTLSDTFVLNNLEVDYMLHKNVVAKMSDITKFKVNLEHHTKEQNNIFQ